MGHRGGAHLALLETLGQQACPCHQPQGRGEARGAGAELVEGAHHLEVQGARVDLAHGEQGRGEIEVLQDPGLQVRDLVGAAAQEGELVKLGADGALEPANRVPRDEVLEAAEGEEEFLAEHREALAKRGRLGGHIVRATGDHQVAELVRSPADGKKRRRGLCLDELQALEDLQLLDVLGEVPAGQPQVDELPLRQLRELLDAGLDVVEGHALPARDGTQVDVALDALVVLDGVRGNRDAEVLLGLHHRDPEVALEADAPVL